jgi:hypothetical protein
MKAFLKSFFEYIGDEKNFRESVLIIAANDLFFVALGLFIAWIVFILANKKSKHHDPTPVSFDDLGIPTTGFRRRKSY